MKSVTSPTPSSVRNLVISIAVSGKYNCLDTYLSVAGAIRAYPPLSASSSDANTLGESNRGQQNQSTVPSVVTSAAVCRSPIRP
jgi:hypothetical protein